MSFDPLSLTYDDRGLIPAIAQDAEAGEVLMMAWMNADAVAQTLETGPGDLLVALAAGVLGQGRDSGHVQRLVEMRVDCDRDCLLVLDRAGRAGLSYQPAQLLSTRSLEEGGEKVVMAPEAD